MRKIKLALQCRVPSWNFCNYDGFTPDHRYSKELCRFCISTKQGHYCALHDEWLTQDKKFVHKSKACIDATAGFAVTVDEQVPNVQVDPKVIIAETLKSYKKIVDDLRKQGYPQSMAETVATKYILEDK